MGTILSIHPDSPQARLLNQVETILRGGGVIAYPTDSGYALGCQLGDKHALERIRSLRQLDKHHHFTLVCRDLSQLGTYAYASNAAYRLIKRYTPGPYTFILQASKIVPKRLLHPKRRTIGVRVPDHAICRCLLDVLGEPLMSVSWIEQEEDDAMPVSPDIDMLQHKVDVVIDGGFCPAQPTSVIDFVEAVPKIIRRGRGDVGPFEDNV